MSHPSAVSSRTEPLRLEFNQEEEIVTLVIKGGTLIDGTGAKPLQDSVVVIEKDILREVGPAATVRWPADATIIDAGGKTVMPGIIDCHAHMIAYEYNLEKRITTPASLTVLKTLKNLESALQAGVTTVRDGGGADAGIKMGIDQGLAVGPRLLISIVPITQTGGLFDLSLTSGAKLDMSAMYGKVRLFCGGVEELRQTTRRLLLEGADVIKISTTGSVYSHPGRMPAPQFTLEEINTVVYEAQAAGKKTMTHCEGGPGLRNAVLAGIDSIEHGFYLSDEDIELMLKKGSFLVPTLACNYGILKVIERDPKAGIHEQSIRVARDIIADHAVSFRKAVEAGVKIAMGSDAFGWDQGENLFELELMVKGGMTPMQAILSATGRAAELLDVQDRLGTLSAGKIADVLVVDGNPLDDITVLQKRDNLQMIMKGGQVFKNTLDGAA